MIVKKTPDKRLGKTKEVAESVLPELSDKFSFVAGLP